LFAIFLFDKSSEAFFAYANAKELPLLFGR